jgi:HPt (histidine-containing phosphotransfer) domain-containing protein
MEWSNIIKMDNLVNRENITKTIGSNPDLIKKIITLYFRDAPKLLDEVGEAVNEGDNKKLSEKAHALKGITSYYNTDTIYNLCLQLEQFGKGNNMPEKNEEIKNSLIQLKNMLSLLIEQLKIYSEQL